MKHIIVVGAGMVGLSVSGALLEKGYRVTLLDENQPGSGTSSGNAGLIANYATTPLANPDSLRALLTEFTRSKRALSIDPRYLPALTGFGRAFLRATGSGPFAENKRTLVELVARGTLLQQQLLDKLGSNELYQTRGCLQIYRRDTPMGPQLAELAAAKQRDGVQCEALDREALLNLEPGLNPQQLAGGLWYPDTWSLRHPRQLCIRLHQQLLAQGLDYRPLAAESVSETGGRALIRAGDQELAADAAVLCAGMGNQQLLAPQGIRLPVVSERGYHLMLDDRDLVLNRPVGWLDRYFYATPMAEGIRIAGTTQFARPGAPVAVDRHRHMQEWAASLFGRPVTVTSRWMGVRHSTPDSLPVIGALPEHKHVLLAFGHGHLGMTLGAITGQLIVEALAGRQTDRLARALSPARFL
ncbi:NAD(P)/FAD-dependent oxidoreductase [Zobellella maritima]|uniref:NAD(P)/FAD-dependent oxidoreductase n=1 Tax=Zobellella maritima TaxID=2059725 RepID=UPI0013002DC6|nr:FAD-dependent oxidoreductase [Zobellella maritima]